jgi:hypothetical protein
MFRVRTQTLVAARPRKAATVSVASKVAATKIRAAASPKKQSVVAAAAAAVAARLSARKRAAKKKAAATMAAAEKMRRIGAKLAATHVEFRFAQELSSVPYADWLRQRKWQRIAAALGDRRPETAKTATAKSASGGSGGEGGDAIVTAKDLERAVFPQGPLGLESKVEQRLYAVLRKCIAAVTRGAAKDEGGDAGDDDSGGEGEDGSDGNGGGGDGSEGGDSEDCESEPEKDGGDGDGDGDDDDQEEEEEEEEDKGEGGGKKVKGATTTTKPKLASHLEATVRAYTDESAIYRDMNERLRCGDDIACWTPFVDCLADACDASRRAASLAAARGAQHSVPRRQPRVVATRSHVQSRRAPRVDPVCVVRHDARRGARVCGSDAPGQERRALLRLDGRGRVAHSVERLSGGKRGAGGAPVCFRGRERRTRAGRRTQRRR